MFDTPMTIMPPNTAIPSHYSLDVLQSVSRLTYPYPLLQLARPVDMIVGSGFPQLSYDYNVLYYLRR